MMAITFDETKWKLVPVEPTREMIDAMPPVEETGYWAMYSAATNAAPSHPAVPMSESQRADMICAIAAICTGTSSRTVAATAIEWVERYYGITTPAAQSHPAVLWKVYESQHLRSIVVTEPNGMEHEIMSDDIAHPRVRRLFNRMLEALNRRSTLAALREKEVRK